MKIIKNLLNVLKMESTKDIERKQEIDSAEVPGDEQTIYFKDGKMYKTSTDCETDWYDARYLVSDDVLYNLESTEDINNIPIPKFDKFADMMSGYGVTGSLDYVLRMKAGKFYNRGEKELCSACLWKATEMMFCSGIGWKKDDFYRLVNWHYELGLFDEAKKAEEYLQSKDLFQISQFDLYASENKNHVFDAAHRFNIDLVAFNDYGTGCCKECAKMRGRVYSISGKSRNFPKLPNYVKIHGNFHPGCRCMMSLFSKDAEDEIYYKGEKINAISSSNRPWVDDRDNREIALYEDYIKRVQENVKKANDRKEYYKLLELCPDIAPKSFSAYRRMKNSKTNNFMNLYSIAKTKGLEIDLS